MPVKKEPPEMSAFERKRLANMAANRAILTDISAAARKILPARNPPAAARSTPAAPRRTRRSEPIKREAARPTRVSSRLAGLEADNQTLKRKLEVEAEHQAREAKAKKLRVNGELNLGDIAVEGRNWAAGVGSLQGIVRGAQPGVRTFTEEEIRETTDGALRALRERMGGLKMYEHWVPNDIKITPQRVYALGFHPTEDKPVVFAGDKEGAVGIFDGSQTPPEVDDDDDDDDKTPHRDPEIAAFKTHARTVTSFVFPPDDPNAVYTCSYDSSIRKMDLQKGTSTQIFAPPDMDTDMPLSAMDAAHPDPHLLYFSTLDGSVGRVDVRSSSSTTSTTTEIWTLSEQKIGGFSLHPLQPHLLATASLDRTLKIWDLRMMNGNKTRQPTLVGEHGSRLSVSHVSWSAAGHVATSSYDDTVKIYDFADAGAWTAGSELPSERMQPAHVVRHNNQTGRWVTILKPQWQRRPRDGIQKFVIANMNRFVDVFAADGSQLAQLDGGGITAVPAVAHFHPTLEWVAGGNGSGKLCLWL